MENNKENLEDEDSVHEESNTREEIGDTLQMINQGNLEEGGST